MPAKKVKVPEIPIRGISAFIDAITEIRMAWHGHLLEELWFRGVADKARPLLPGAYWRKECDEYSLVLTFKSMVPSLVEREPLDDWEWYYLMQHYSLPTRLLDWSESPLFALYFALAENSSKPPCVWVLDPVALNRITQGPDNASIVVPPSSHQENSIRYWLPGFCGRGKTAHRFETGTCIENNENPVAIFPKRHNPRIVAQRGVFTIHGAMEIPIEKLMCETADEPEPRIAKFTFLRSACKKLREELWSLGVTKTVLFPEPQSVAEDIRKQYKTDK